jgi:hypothetical protein
MSNALQTADRVLQVLAAFDSTARELSVSRIADALGVHKSTASRLATTLVQRGFLERRKRTLRLGPEVNRLGLLALGNVDLTAMADEAMQWLCSKTGETVHLAVLDGAEALNIAQVDGPACIAPQMERCCLPSQNRTSSRGHFRPSLRERSRRSKPCERNSSRCVSLAGHQTPENWRRD